MQNFTVLHWDSVYECQSPLFYNPALVIAWRMAMILEQTRGLVGAGVGIQTVIMVEDYFVVLWCLLVYVTILDLIRGDVWSVDAYLGFRTYRFKTLAL